MNIYDNLSDTIRQIRDEDEFFKRMRRNAFNSLYGANALKPHWTSFDWIRVPGIKKVIFNPPATIVLWADNTKTVVKAQGEDNFNPEVGLAMAISKKALGNKGSYYNTIKKWVDEYEETNAHVDRVISSLKNVVKVNKTFAEEIKKATDTLVNLHSKAYSECSCAEVWHDDKCR